MMKITGFMHASLLVSDLGKAREFYEGVLGLLPSPNRPSMEFFALQVFFSPGRISWSRASDIAEKVSP